MTDRAVKNERSIVHGDESRLLNRRSAHRLLGREAFLLSAPSREFGERFHDESLALGNALDFDRDRV